MNPILVVIFFSLLIILIFKLHHIKKKKILNTEIPNVERPFVNVFDQEGNKLNVILISKPFTDDKHHEKCLELKKNNIIIGISSYLEFPNMVTNPYENFVENYKKYKYKKLAEGWIHCFRKPEKYFPKRMPLLFQSESDYTDCNINKPDPTIKKEYDFIYICLKVNEKKDTCDDWATWNKNWELAQKCLKIMCNKYKLKGLLVGRKGCNLPNGCNTLMETTNMVSNEELKKMYNKSRFIFLPNEKDASPRVLTEALCCDVPVLLNKNILGGWKYVNKNTGEFFTDEKDIDKSIEKIMFKIRNDKYSPREYFINNYSIINSGKKLKKYLYENFGNRINIPQENVEYLTPAYVKENYTQCKSTDKL